MSQIKMAAPCLLGLEGLVAGELRSMQAQNVEAQNGRVLFEGDEAVLARANLCSRYAERIQILLGVFQARTFEQLFQGVKALPWEMWIGKSDAFPVKGRSLDSKLASVPDCQSIMKKAIVERLKTAYHLPWFEETGAVHQVQFLLMKDKVSVMLDTSGAGLHKRGYRANAAEAPIKETLAAAMAYLAHVRADSTLYDPFCGSGTILIESALLALRIAPGLRRRFAAEKWMQIPGEVWSAERRRAQEQILQDRPFTAYGSDIDPHVLQLAEENARKAGVGGCIRVEQRSVADFVPKTESGMIICNPPYGERLLDIRQAEELYAVMGRVFPQEWSSTVISPSEHFEALFGRPAQKRRKLYNGMIRCQVFLYPAQREKVQRV
ncbi:MAG: class I SAM-dependent RNA methyltransferase [Firmicutes bacterium]|nr:class I SAM-dependent RNA methyltransferase [Bacillota bacterium]